MSDELCKTCLEALRHGANNFVVNDMEAAHMLILAMRIKNEFPNQSFDGLSFLVAKFPVDQNAIGSIAFINFLRLNLLNFIVHGFTWRGTI